jgi:hypothetical protein
MPDVNASQLGFMGFLGVVTPPTSLSVSATEVSVIKVPNASEISGLWKSGDLAGFWLEIRVVSGTVYVAGSPPEAGVTMANSAPVIMEEGDTDGRLFHGLAAFESPLVALQADGVAAVVAYQIYQVKAGGGL